MVYFNILILLDFQWFSLSKENLTARVEEYQVSNGRLKRVNWGFLSLIKKSDKNKYGFYLLNIVIFMLLIVKIFKIFKIQDSKYKRHSVRKFPYLYSKIDKCPNWYVGVFKIPKNPDVRQSQNQKLISITSFFFFLLRVTKDFKQFISDFQVLMMEI